MQDLEQEANRLERQRRELVVRLYELLDELEDPNSQRSSASGFPFSLLEQSIYWSLMRIERWVRHMVAAVLKVQQ